GPNQAVKWLKSLPSGRERDYILQCSIGKLAGREPNQALALFKSLKPAEMTPGLEAALFGQWAAYDPAASASAAETNSIKNPQIFREIARAWAKKDIASAVSWVRGLPETTRRSNMICGLCDAISRSDPNLASELAETLPRGSTRDEAVSTIAAGIADND